MRLLRYWYSVGNWYELVVSSNWWFMIWMMRKFNLQARVIVGDLEVLKVENVKKSTWVCNTAAEQLESLASEKSASCERIFRARFKLRAAASSLPQMMAARAMEANMAAEPGLAPNSLIPWRATWRASVYLCTKMIQLQQHQHRCGGIWKTWWSEPFSKWSVQRGIHRGNCLWWTLKP